MHAQPGDWLVIEQANIEALVFPGPDAHVVTPDEVNLAARPASARAAQAHREIAAHRSQP